jgi:Kef-type K+ transport system membrane component KefB
MACDDCARRQLAENVDGLEYDVDELKRVKRNQGIALVVVVVAGLLVLSRLNAKGVLTWAELLTAPASD